MVRQKKKTRRAARLPRETTQPRRRFVVPRHAWPAALNQLTEARAAFVTGIGLPSPGLDLAAPVEVFVADRGAVILEGLGACGAGAGSDPWRARLREIERQARAAAAERARHDVAAADALEAAFQREAERVRLLQERGGEL